MVVRSLALGVAAVVAMAGSTAVGAAEPGKNTTVSGLPLGTQEMFTLLTGEFQGDVQKLGPDGKLVKNEVTASNRVDQNGRRLTSCFECDCNGSPLDGAVVWNSPATGKAGTSWCFDNQSCAGTGTMAAREMTFSGKTLGANTTAKFEQTVSVFNANHYQVAWNRIEPNGQKTLVMHLDMKRMGEGRKSAAASKFDSSNAVASAKSAIETNQRQANANGE